MADLAAGWYVIIRDSDTTISSLYRYPNGKWDSCSGRLPAGWRVGPRVDELMAAHKSAATEGGGRG